MYLELGFRKGLAIRNEHITGQCLQDMERKRNEECFLTLYKIPIAEI